MRKKQLLIFLFLLFLTSGLILPNCNSVLGNGHRDILDEATQPFELDLEGWNIWAAFISLGKWVTSGIIAALSWILIVLTGAFLGLSQFLLEIVTSENFINISFTGGDNIFVTKGWEMVKGLTNIFIVLGFVVIALATILRIESYQMKKTLPLLIIVAILINFTPMLCGLVIDASNFIMKGFLKGGGLLTEGLLGMIGTEVSGLWQTDDISETLARGVVAIGFNVITGLIFLLFAFLFLFRYIALWMLVILSPLALFCYIFPSTKKIWNMWLSQFVQWCFIGIPAAFTILLANIMIVNLVEGGAIEGIKGGAEILGYLVPLAFLAGGFLMSLQIGAIGANLAITGFNWTKSKIWAGTKWGARKGTKKLREKTGDWLGKDQAADEKKIKELREEGKGPGFGYHLRKVPGVRRLGRTLSAGATEADKEDIEKREKKAKGTSIDNQAKMMESVSVLNRIAGLLAAMKDGNIKRLKEQGLLSENKIKSIMKDAVKIYPTAMRDLRKISPKLSKEVADTAEAEKTPELTLREAGIYFDKVKDKEKGWKNLEEKLFATAKPKDIEDIWDEDTIEAYAKSRVSHLFAAPNQLAAATRVGGRGFINDYNEKGKELADKEGLGLEALYKKYNPPVWSYRSHTSAQGLGIGFETVEAVEEKITSAQELEQEKEEKILEEVKEKEKKKEKKDKGGIGKFESKV